MTRGTLSFADHMIDETAQPADADALSALELEVGSAAPAAIAELSPEQLALLRTAVIAARRRQADALQDAIDSGLGFLPRILRGAVKRALLG
jgi:hypothetical protein